MKDLDTAIQEDLSRQGKSAAEITSLILDGKCKCSSLKGLAPLQNLEVLSLANTKLSSLEDFPSLPKLNRLTLSDNPQLSGGLKLLVTAAPNLRKLSLAATRISRLSELEHLAGLPQLISLDLLDCPVVSNLGEGYRTKVLAMLSKLEWLDNMDRNGAERDASDEEEEEFDEEGGEEDHDEGGGGGEGGHEDDEAGGGEDEEEEEAEDVAEGVKPYAALVGEEPLIDDEDEDEYEEEEEGEDDEIDEDEEGEEGGEAGPSTEERGSKRKRGQGEEEEEEEEDEGGAE